LRAQRCQAALEQVRPIRRYDGDCVEGAVRHFLGPATGVGASNDHERGERARLARYFVDPSCFVTS
jgi:hypothetical protein